MPPSRSIPLLCVCLALWGLLAPQAAAQEPPPPIAIARLDGVTPATRQLIAGMGIEARGTPFGDGVVLFLDPDDLQRLRAAGLDPLIIESDAQRFFRSRLDPGLGPGSMGGYYTLAEAEAKMDELAARFPEVVSPKFSVGTSVEGRTLWVFRMSDTPGVSDPTRPALFYNGLIHAREPIGMMLLLSFAEDLASKYAAGDEGAAYLLATRELWFEPVVNPDGYYYNQMIAPAGGGMWRKNKADNDGSGFFTQSADGVDLNRNFSYQWGYDDYGSSPNPRSETYRGTAPFSEPETQAVRDVVLGAGVAAAPDWSFILNYHAYASVYIYPWGYTTDTAADQAVFRDWASHLSATNHFAYGTGVQTIGYRTNGDAVDWAYGDQGLLAMVPEVGSLFDYFWPPSVRIPVIVAQQTPANWLTLWMAGGVLLPGPFQITDPAGDGDGLADPGETVELRLQWENPGVKQAVTGASATLTGLSPDVTVTDAIAVLGDFAVGETRAVSDPFTILLGSPPEGRLLQFAVRVEADGGYVRLDTLGVVAGGPTTLLDETFEQGTSRWILGGGFDRTNDQAASGQWSLSDGAAGFGPQEINWMDLAEPLDLSRFSGARLIFSSDRQVGPDNAALVTIAGHPDPWPYAVPPSIPDPLVYYAPTNGVPGFEQVTVDLSDYVGTPGLYLRLASVYRSASGAGWSLDDVRVEAWTEAGGTGGGASSGSVTLGSPYPNPSNPAPGNEIRMDVDLSEFTSGLVYALFRVYDVRGRLVKRTFEGSLQRLRYPEIFRWDGTNEDGQRVASGIYLLRVDAGGHAAVRKVVILR